MVRTLIRIHHVNRFMAALEPVPYEREQDSILFFVAVEESADMPRLVKLRAGKRNGSGGLLHNGSPHGMSNGSPGCIKDASLRGELSTRHFGIADTLVQYPSRHPSLTVLREVATWLCLTSIDGEQKMNDDESFSTSRYEEQVHLAERELWSFIRSVMELFGPEQAQVSTQDWLEEAERMDIPLRATRDWRAVTIAASAQLAY